MKHHSFSFLASLLPGAVIGVAAVLAVFSLQSATMGAEAAEERKPILSKDYIDTTIMQAIYLLSEGASVDGVGFAREKAIADARAAGERLRAEAKGDPNESYVLWKVEELDGQITLEEKDLVLEKMRKGKETIDQLAEDFNREVGKDRPDFAALQQFQSQMKGLDPQRAEAMGKSVASRLKSLSRAAVDALEEALIYGNAAKADEEFRYCLRYRQYFDIPPATFRNLETRVSACDQSVEELKVIRGEADSARASIAATALGRARTILADAENRLSVIKGQILIAEDSACAWRLIQLTSALKLCEDSLVQANLDILKSKGSDAASEYLNRVVHPAGVSREKSARIDQAILAASSPDAKNNSMGREVDAVTAASDSDASHDVFEEMRQKAIKKVRARQDSIDAIEAAREKLELARLDSMEATAKIKAELEFQANRTNAMRISSAIYGLIQNGKAREAGDMFDNKKPQLRQYLIPEAYALLEAAARQILDGTWDSAPNEIQLVATASPGKGGAQANNAAHSSAEHQNQEKARAAIETIYGLLDRNDLAGAARQFDNEKAFLQTYLDKDTYELVRLTVDRSGESPR